MPDKSSPRPPLAFDAAEEAPLFGAALLFASGIAVDTWLWITPTLLFAGTLGMILISIWAYFLAPRLHGLANALLWLLLGCFAAGLEPQPMPDAALRGLSDGLMRSFTGRIVSFGPVAQPLAESSLNSVEPNSAANTAADSEPQLAPPRSEPWQRVDLELASVESVDDNSDAMIPASGVVRLIVAWPRGFAMPELHCGSTLQATAQIKIPSHYVGPGLWSRTNYLLTQGVTSTARLSGKDLALLPGRSRPSVECYFAELRNHASESLVALPAAMRGYPAWLRLTPADGVLLASLITGDRTMLSPALRVGFERTGSFTCWWFRVCIWRYLRHGLPGFAVCCILAAGLRCSPRLASAVSMPCLPA